MRPDAFMLVTKQDRAVPGESTDGDAGENAIEILSFTQVIQQVSGSAPNGTSLAEHRPLKVLKLLDNASPTLHDYASQRFTNLTVKLGLANRTGDSKGKSDTWKRKRYVGVTLENACIVGVNVVVDPRAHAVGGRFLADTDLLTMGPLEELEIDYGKITFWYGKSSNKMTWTHSRFAADAAS